MKAGIGAKHGLVVKMWGESGEGGGEGKEVGAVAEWEEVVLAGYTSFKHFVDMLADPEYQDVNLKLRLPALRDTCILMTSELHLDWMVEGAWRWSGGS
jgi:hypothetical protein